MERRVELLSALGACVLGLIGVVMEAQATANPLANIQFSWLIGSNAFPGLAGAILNVQHALLPMAIVLVALALGAYLHAIQGWAVGFALLVSSSAIVIIVAGFMVFNSSYAELLVVPAPLVVFTSVLAGVASVCALSSLGADALFLRHVLPRLRSFRHARSREAL